MPIFTNAFEKVQTPNYQDMIAHSHNKIKPASAVAGPNREAAQFNPYQNNQGTVIGKFRLYWPTKKTRKSFTKQSESEQMSNEIWFVELMINKAIQWKIDS